MKQYKRIVIKIGSNVLTREDGMPNTTRISAIVDQIAALHSQGIEIILVSSGAVASGRGIMQGKYDNLDAVSSRQLFSAIGQVRLINRYYDLFGQYGITCGQILTTKSSLSTRRDYLNQRNCMETMLSCGVIPIVNENDTISITELMFTDNDELSGLVASMMSADLLLILSNIDGIYNGPPQAQSSRVIERVEPQQDLSEFIDTARSSRGRGGMLTKSRIASRIAGEGIEVIIANGTRHNIIKDIILQQTNVVCTRFIATQHTTSNIKKWIASSESFAKGAIYINDGAAEAIRNNKAASILAIGITRIENEFSKDDIVRIFTDDGTPLGIGRISYDSQALEVIIGKHNHKAVVHYDYLYLE